MTIAWLRRNLFSTWRNSLLTVLGALLIYFMIVPTLDWAVFGAVWHGDTREACLVPDAGACWPFIKARAGQIIYGFYDAPERWRADIVFLVGGAGIAWLVLPKMPFKFPVAALMVTAYPALAYFLLSGGEFGLAIVPTQRWGGLLLTLIISAVGIAASLPLGILLALGRRSKLPLVRWFSIGFIELWRGVPLITVLFMASNLLPLFMGEGAESDKLLRALIAVALFSAAYMAEVVRGGLQALPRGQYEAAEALGLSYWRMNLLVILPQALKIVIPGIVNQFISLFKDTTLVSIIGFFDLLGVIQSGNADPQWGTPQTAFTGYFVAGLIFFVFCFAMSRYSMRLERKLAYDAEVKAQ